MNSPRRKKVGYRMVRVKKTGDGRSKARSRGNQRRANSLARIRQAIESRRRKKKAQKKREYRLHRVSLLRREVAKLKKPEGRKSFSLRIGKYPWNRSTFSGEPGDLGRYSRKQLTED